MSGSSPYPATALFRDFEYPTPPAGNAVFTGHKQLTITPDDGGKPETIKADRIVLAAGGRPIIPDIQGLPVVPHHTSDTIMRLPEFPRRVIILGGGFVAAEFAHVFGSLGAHVTLIVRSGALPRVEDADISQRFTDLATQHWDTGSTPRCCPPNPSIPQAGAAAFGSTWKGPTEPTPSRETCYWSR